MFQRQPKFYRGAFGESRSVHALGGSPVDERMTIPWRFGATKVRAAGGGRVLELHMTTNPE
jgi:hypothetical protein